MHQKADLVKIHYKGKGGQKSSDHPEDFIVFAESAAAVREWKQDKSKPLVDVANSFDIFVTGKHGNQGELNRASKSQLDSEFGSSKDVDCLEQILEHGNIIETQSSEAKGHRNVANGSGSSVRE